MKVGASVSVLLLLFFFFKPIIFAGENIDVSYGTNYSIRVDGAEAGQHLGRYMLAVADMNGNNRNDLLVGGPSSTFNGANSGSLYIIYDDILATYTGTGNSIDLSISTNYNIRIDGPAASTFLGYDGSFSVKDLDNDGKADIAVAAPYADYNSRNDSGSIYFIYNTILQGISGTGNTLDLSVSTSFNQRYDGPQASGALGEGSLVISDMNGDGLNDVVFNAEGVDYNSRNESGSMYILYNALINSVVGTGNTIDLATTSNFNIRFDGESAEDYLGFAGTTTGDVNTDGNMDLLFVASAASKNGRSGSGSVYLLYNDRFSSLTGTANIVDLATTMNYSIRFDGAAANDTFAAIGIGIGDVTNNGFNDLSFGSQSDNNSLNNSGSIYILYDSLLSAISGTGNTVDLADSDSYTVRIDGPSASAALGLWSQLDDVNRDGKIDLIAAAYGSGFNSRSTSGSVYILYNEKIDDFSGTGLTSQLTNSDSYSLRYDGAASTNLFGNGGNLVADINNDNVKDLLISARGSSFNGRANSGSLYIFFGSSYSAGNTTNRQVHVPQAHSACVNQVPSFAPDLYQSKAKKHTVSLQFAPAGDPITGYEILYGYKDGVERFGTSFPYNPTNGSVTYDISGLTPNTTYFFRVRGKNNCMPGPVSNTLVVTTDKSNTVGELLYTAFKSQVRRIFPKQ